jgi:hypothetical protein
MFDIDGTLIESYKFDSECFGSAVKKVTNLETTADWQKYLQVTESRILRQIF